MISETAPTAPTRQQLLAVYAQVNALPALTSEHKAAVQVPATAAGWEFFGFKGEFHRIAHRSVSELQMPYPITDSIIA